MKTLTLTGLLAKHSWGEADGILFLSSLDDPIAEYLSEKISRKKVTVRYWITNAPATKEEAKDSFIQLLCGNADCKFGSRYSEMTGYLWTDEKCNVGGHDLINELKSHAGKWLILEIEIHP